MCDEICGQTVESLPLQGLALVRQKSLVLNVIGIVPSLCSLVVKP